MDQKDQECLNFHQGWSSSRPDSILLTRPMTNGYRPCDSIGRVWPCRVNTRNENWYYVLLWIKQSLFGKRFDHWVKWMFLHVSKHLHQFLPPFLPPTNACDERVLKKLPSALTLSGVLLQTAVNEITHVCASWFQLWRLEVDDRLHGLRVFLPQERRLSLN